VLRAFGLYQCISISVYQYISIAAWLSVFGVVVRLLFEGGGWWICGIGYRL
jgi:hypothetical protein